MPAALNSAVLAEIGVIGSDQGYDLVGYMTDERDGTILVLLRRPYQNLDPYVVGRVDRLTDTEWRSGAYYGNSRAAARGMLRRAGVDVE